MNRIEFGPLVTQQRLSPNETQYFLDRYQNQPEHQNITTDLPDLSQRGWMKRDDENYNKILQPYILNHCMLGQHQGGYKIDSLWGNVYRGNDFVPPHVHHKCDLSFVLFLKMPSLEFLNSNKNEGCLVLRYGEDVVSKIPNKTNHYILPKVGELIIFPYNLLHYTIPMSHPQAERISMSGNIILTNKNQKL